MVFQIHIIDYRWSSALTYLEAYLSESKILLWIIKINKVKRESEFQLKDF